MRIAYTIQNVGNIDFSQDIGDTVPVKNSLLGLQRAGHVVDCYRLNGQSVIRIPDVSSPETVEEASLGVTGKSYFRSLEGSFRRLQRIFRIPYFALFDSYRFYEGCMRVLPRYDICHEHNGLFSIGTSMACSRLNIPYILTFSADPLMELQLVGKPLRGIHKSAAIKEAAYSYKVADRIICVSQEASHHLIAEWQVPPEKIVVLPNGVDINLFSQNHDPNLIRSAIGWPEGVVIGFVGGFQHWHGLDLLVESFAAVLDCHPTAKLFLVGDGPARESIETLVKKRNLENSVKFSGLVPQKQVPAYLAVIDIAVLPYPKLPKDLWFSPLKLYEYMASGKAIVASDSGQISEVIIDGTNGILVEAGSTADLTAAIINLIDDIDKRINLGRNAQRQAKRQHSWDSYVNRLESVYSNVINETKQVAAQQGEYL